MNHKSSFINHTSSFINHKSFIILIAVASLAIFLHPLLKPGVIAGHDAGYHFTREQLFTTALKEGLASLALGRSGQFPVRWLEGPVPGITHPLFEFYPPLFYYPVGFLMLLGLPYVPSTYVVLTGVAALAWVGMFLFVSHLSDESHKTYRSYLAASFAATLFLFTPYRVSQLYVRAAYGEFLATAMTPWAFWAIAKIFSDVRVTRGGEPQNRGPLVGGFWGYRAAGPERMVKYILLLAFSLSAILTSHQPTLIMLLVPLTAWTIFLWFKTQHTKALFAAVSGALLAAVLSAWFILPMLAEKDFIRAARLTTGYFDFRQHFAFFSQLVYSTWGYGISQPGLHDGMSFQVGIINWGVILAFLGLALWHHKSLFINHKSSFFFFSLFIFSLFMATAASLPLWERFSFLQFVQYPWRYLAVAAFATSVLGGILVGHLSNLGNLRYLGLAFLLPILFNLKYIAPSAYMPRDMFNLNNPNLAQYNSPENPFFGVELGYFPIWVSDVNTDPKIQRFTLLKGKADIKPITDTMIRQSATISVKDYATIRVNTHYFPGWVAEIDDGKEKKTVTPGYNNSYGNMEVSLAPGDYTVTFQFTKTPVRQWGDWISVGTALGLALSSIWIFWPRRFWSKYSGATSPALRYQENASSVRPKRKK